MLTRIRIEVSDEDSAAATSEALDNYESAVIAAEAERYRVLAPGDDEPENLGAYVRQQLGREVTDEVIEYDASLPGYKGRRVVQFKRLDTRSDAFREPAGTEGSHSSTVTLKHGPPGFFS